MMTSCFIFFLVKRDSCFRSKQHVAVSKLTEATVYYKRFSTLVANMAYMVKADAPEQSGRFERHAAKRGSVQYVP